jgi:hypothetical protein
MIVSIHQPSYFPWLGLLDKISKSDKFVILDTVQLNDNAFQNRNIFLNQRGEVEYLTIPIIKKGYLEKSIRELIIANNKWQKKHHGFIIANYKKHPYFDEVYSVIKPLYQQQYVYLVDVLIDSMEMTFQLFNIATDVILASELDIDKNLKKDDLVIDILKKVNASVYLSGSGAKQYHDETKFKTNNIVLQYQIFKHPIYKQKNALEFIPGLSSLDIAFNLGINQSTELIKGLT